MIAPRHRPRGAFVLAAAGLGIGIGIDFLAVGVTAVPNRLVLHRAVLLFALGVFAAGCAEQGAARRRTQILGLVAWAAALAVPLADVL